ncbi:host specificity protein J [Pseudomonas aeruginosa]|uniref:host specificity protein J n=2 Tax=Pseudomonas aeruginosa TaxID=287 RepID=UPI002F925C80
MGAVHQHLAGRKGGSSKPKQPSIAPDSLQSVATAKILIAVGEGEFAEGPTERGIYLDNTPLMDASGNLNFPNVKWEFRPGSVDQEYIPGIPAVENETSVNVELRSESPWVRSLSNTQLSAVRLRLAWPALQQQDTNGNIGGYRIEYAVDVATDGGAYEEVLREAVDGKTTTRYERSRRIDLPAAASGWQVRVRRLTPNKNSSLVSDTMLIAAYSEVIDAKLRYPGTALLFIEFSAEQFSNIPAVTLECKGRKWMVPSNYDPDTRTYSGVWDGTMKLAWTNNPAWITYGISTNDLFGLGKRIKSWMVDKWELYRIAQYCDQLVPDGKGGQEPRFLCDMNLQSKAGAWELLRDIAAIYRGMSYWANGQLVSQADMPRGADFDYVFTRANVIDGRMEYGAASPRARYGRALVSYDNPANNYDTDVTAFADPELQRRYNDNMVEVSAIGCTRESEAKRRGKWVVLTSVLDRAVTFSTGLEGRIPLPGHIIPVADAVLAGREIGGRISAVAGRVITLDRDTLAKAGDRLLVNLPNGRAEGRTIEAVNGRQVTVTTAYSMAPEPQLCWALDAEDLAVQLYRVMSVKRNGAQWTISGLQHDPSKYDAIDTGTRIEERPISVVPVTTVPAPASVTLSSRYQIDQGLAVSTMTITWPAVEGAVAYDVEWKKDSGNWIRLPRAGTTSVDVTGIYAGGYLARVRAVSAFDITSVWKSSILTQLSGKTGAPPAVAYLRTQSRVFGIGLEWGFPAGAEDTQRTEIWYGTTTDREQAKKLGDFAFPQAAHEMQGLAAGVSFFFWARLIDRTGNIGAWYPAGAGTNGQSSSDQTEYDRYFSDRISESALNQGLKDKIGEIDDLSEKVTDLLNNSTAYDPAKIYSKGDVVYHNGRLYQWSSNTSGNIAPPSEAYWTDIGQISAEVGALAARVEQNTTNIGVIDGKLTAQAESINGLVAQVTPDAAGDTDWGAGDSNVYAGTVTVQSVSADADLATAIRVDSVKVSVDANAAAIVTEQQARASADNALASNIQALSATVGSNTAAIQQVSQAQTSTDGQLSAMWAVKMQVTAGGQYVAAGIGLGIENEAGVFQSQFLVDVNRFAVVNTANGQLTAPFVIQNGQTFISQALIGTGWITNAMIGNVIQSTALGANGEPLWKLDKAGSLTMNSATSGGFMRQTAEAVKVYDANLVLRVQIGNLDA